MTKADELALAAAVVALLIVNQVRLRPVRERAPIVLNVLLIGYGIITLRAGIGSVTDSRPISVGVGALLAAEVMLAVAFGALRARTITVLSGPDGRAMRRGGAATVAVWLIGLAAHLAVGVAIDHAAGTGRLGVSTVFGYLAVTLIVQNMLVRARSARSMPGRIHGQVTQRSGAGH